MTQGVRTSFSHNDEGKISISFFDPVYARAEMILFDRRTGNLHAVVHEASHYIGQAPEDIAGVLAEAEEVCLTAALPDSSAITLHAQIVQY